MFRKKKTQLPSQKKLEVHNRQFTMGEESNTRGGNLYSPWYVITSTICPPLQYLMVVCKQKMTLWLYIVLRTLQGNWLEDRVQGSVGTNDGLRCTDIAYKEMMENPIIYQGPKNEVSMPATQYGNVTTQEPSVKLFECTRYKHPMPMPTGRVISNYQVSPSIRMATTSMLMSHGDKRTYTKDPRKPMVDATNMKEAIQERPTTLPEKGFGAILPHFTTDWEMGTRFFETTSRLHFVNKSGRRPSSPPRDSLSSHPNPPHSPTVDVVDKGTDGDKGAGFAYDKTTAYNPIPFPSKNVDGGDPWGRTKAAKVPFFGRHHVTSTIRMFVDARGIDPPRLGITVRTILHALCTSLRLFAFSCQLTMR